MDNALMTKEFLDKLYPAQDVIDVAYRYMEEAKEMKRRSTFQRFPNGRSRFQRYCSRQDSISRILTG